MFDKYAKKLQSLEQNVSEIFKKQAYNGGLFFTSEAVKMTNRAKKVDTGNYKRNWNADVTQKGDAYIIIMHNNVEYASFIEYGYTIKKAHFVPFDKMQGTVKSKKLIAAYRSKYPKAKGFIAKPRKVRGEFIGTMAVRKTRDFIENNLKKIIAEAEKQS